MPFEVNRGIWRRLVKRAAPLVAAFAGAALAFAQAPPQARIKIDTERAVGEMDPHLFGNFAEHLGRCIYGGIYDEESPLADADGFRKDVIDAVKGLNVSLLRWPGGNFASGYHWEDGIGPKEKRPVRRDDAWGALESNRFGTDEFLRYCERIGASRTFASTPASAPSTKPATGSSIAMSPITRTMPTCAAPTAAISHGTSRSGASATRSMGRGNSATAAPKITPSLLSRRPKPCGAPTIPSS